MKSLIRLLVVVMVGCGMGTGALQAELPSMSVAAYKAVYPASYANPPLKMPTGMMPDGPLLGNGDMAVTVGGYPQRQQFWLAKNDFWQLKPGSGGPRVFGWLYLDMPDLAGFNYSIEQPFADGVVSSRFSSKSGDVHVAMKAWVAATENLLVVELSLLKGSPIKASATLKIAGRAAEDNPFPQVSQVSENGVFWGIRGFGPKQAETPVEAACAVRLIGTAATDLKLTAGEEQFNGVPHWHRAIGRQISDIKPRLPFTPAGQSFTLEPGKPVTLVAAMVSKRKNPDYLKAAQQTAIGVTPEILAQLKVKHDDWWRKYWSKSFIAIGSPFLEWRYYASYYLMGACSRDPDFPPGMIGSWLTNDGPAWRGDYTLDYNAHAPFYGLCAGNHLEQADAQFGPMLAFMEKGKKYSQLMFGHDGVMYPVGIGPLGCNTTEGNWSQCGERVTKHGVLWLNLKSCASYCTVIMSERWFMTRDLEMARKVYPFIREVATFWEHELKFENGRYVDDNDGQREGTNCTNPSQSLAMIRMVMKTALDMSAALGIDQGRREKWQHILAHMSEFPTMTWKTNGKTVFREAEKGWDWFVYNPLLIWPIFPFGCIGLESDPKQLEIAHNTVEAMSEGLLHDPLHDVWYDGNGQSSWYPALARIGYDPNMILTALRAIPFYPNGVVINEMHGLENTSIFPSTINEMLLQSYQDVLHLFPCWPRNRDARFGTLRAYGAFLVSAELKGGVVGGVTIVSEKGRDCTLVNPWPGKTVTLVRNGQVAETLTGERFTFKTAAGETIKLDVKESK